MQPGEVNNALVVLLFLVGFFGYLPFAAVLFLALQWAPARIRGSWRYHLFATLVALVISLAFGGTLAWITHYSAVAGPSSSNGSISFAGNGALLFLLTLLLGVGVMEAVAAVKRAWVALAVIPLGMIGAFAWFVTLWGTTTPGTAHLAGLATYAVLSAFGWTTTHIVR